MTKAQLTAKEADGAQGVLIDPTVDNLGLNDHPVSGVALFYMDHAFAGLRFAQQRKVCS
ncbi:MULTISPECIES: hypothetical protein [Pseudomonas]|uniref:hypothetical protein n=1 Tax=Pseudomonas TaxID=286 RepID=UPI001F0A2165|nr:MULTISPECIES: hypothetical protein [Pseudomonas]